jgi:hypothetical protein
MTSRTFNLGDPVKVSYSGYSIAGTFEGYEPRTGWILVRQYCGFNSDGSFQEHNDFSGEAPEDRPLIPAAEEYVVHSDEPLAPAPLSAEWFANQRSYP